MSLKPRRSKTQISIVGDVYYISVILMGHRKTAILLATNVLPGSEPEAA